MKHKSILRAVLKLVATTISDYDFEVDGIYYNKNGDGTVSVTYRGNSFFDYPDDSPEAEKQGRQPLRSRR